jgi:hypothetical protein
MSTTTIAAREFARDLARAKRAASTGPVLITDRGTPAYALLCIKDYYRLAGGGKQETTLLQAMDAISDGDGIDFDPPALSNIQLQVPEFILTSTDERHS